MHVERMKITNEFISLYKGSSKEVVDLSKEVYEAPLVAAASRTLNIIPERTPTRVRMERPSSRGEMLVAAARVSLFLELI